jgi:hypothetical protein
MKNTFLSTRIFAIAFAAFFTLSFATPALAIDEKNTIPVELVFIGNIRNQPVFQLNFSNAQNSEYTIVVRDEFNTVLYKDNIKGENISRKFLLNTDELGDAAVKFEITGTKNDKPVTYEINKTSRSVDNVVISKK